MADNLKNFVKVGNANEKPIIRREGDKEKVETKE